MRPWVRRGAAIIACLAGVAAPVLALLLALQNVAALVVVTVGTAASAALAWVALTRRGATRFLAGGLALLALVGVGVGFFAVFARNQALLDLAAVTAVLVIGEAAARIALGREAAQLRLPDLPAGTVAASPRHAVLLMNPRSGGGKVGRFDLVSEAKRRAIEPVVLQPGDDFRQGAEAAVSRGADILGAAGGDGSQAIVATVAMDHGLPYVCVPAGTRNHLALDLGVDRDDVVGALDAFVDGVERRVDLSTANGRVFVNNVSLGVYGEIVQSADYRDAKVHTMADLLPDLLGPDGNAPELRFRDEAGTPRSTQQLVMVSNNPYQLDRLGGFATRARLDTGTMGIVSISVRNAAEAAELAMLQSAGRLRAFPGLHMWSASEFEVDSDEPIAAGIDGEFVTLDPPIRFAIRPAALTVRVSRAAPGASPAAARPKLDRATISALVGLAVHGLPEEYARPAQ
jgi:diacylglycerol kinase family enzyme